MDGIRATQEQLPREAKLLTPFYYWATRIASLAAAMENGAMPSSPKTGPVKVSRRFIEIDAIRGFALFGVILMNMFNFGAESAEWTAVPDQVAAGLAHGLFETKSLRLFSMLFGLGFALQIDRLFSREPHPLRIYVRRLVVLFGFGALHALLFDGDILMEYAMLGLLLPLFRSLRPRQLLIIAVVLMMVFPLGNLWFPESEAGLQEQREESLPLAVQRLGHPYLGSFSEVLSENVYAIPPHVWSNLLGPESSFALFSMFLLGMCAFRLGFPGRLESDLPMVRKICVGTLAAGLSFSAIEWYLAAFHGYLAYLPGTATPMVRFIGDCLFVFGSTLLAIGYAATIALLCISPAWRNLLRPLANLGRMALTGYLGGSLLFTTLFYGYGFGLLYQLGPLATSLYAIGFYLLLAVFCSVWLSRFRYGPAEWLWRSLTYGQAQPMMLDRKKGSV